MKKILLPTDFSDDARNANEFAMNMYAEEDVEFILLNVWAEPHTSVTTSLSPLLDILEKDSHEGLKNELEHLTGIYPNANLSERSVYGRLSGVVEKIVAHETIDMVVMGTKGASGIARVLMGSNTAEVVEDVRCPVLAIPKNARFIKPQRIAFATDHKKFRNVEDISPLKELAIRCGAEISVVHIEKKKTESELAAKSSEEYIHGIFDNVPHEIHNISTSSIAEGLNTFVDSNNIDMLVVVAHEYNYLEGLFRSSESKNIAMVSKVPLLVLHD